MPSSSDSNARQAILLSFGSRVRERREQLGLSQEDLADRAGLHRTYVSSVERGKRNISLANIQALADALDADVREFFANTTPKQRGHPR